MHFPLLRPPVAPAVLSGRVVGVGGMLYAGPRLSARMVAAGSFANTASHPSQR